MGRPNNNDKLSAEEYRELADVAARLQVAARIAADGDAEESTRARRRAAEYLQTLMAVCLAS